METLQVAAVSDVGLVREQNEDTCVHGSLAEGGGDAQTGPLLLAVADGMGGHRAGEVASRAAVSHLREILTEKAPAVEVPDAAKADQWRQTLAATFQEVNRRLFEQSQNEPDKAGMGTTLTAAVVAGVRVYIAHVGDSRAYLYDGERLRQLTEDDSVVGQLVRAGRLSQEEARVHPQRNVLTQALGGADAPTVQFVQCDLEPAAVLLLCSDGLTGPVGAGEIADVLAPLPAAYRDGLLDEWAGELVQRAKERGGPDNVTVLLAARPPVPEGD